MITKARTEILGHTIQSGNCRSALDATGGVPCSWEGPGRPPATSGQWAWTQDTQVRSQCGRITLSGRVLRLTAPHLRPPTLALPLQAWPPCWKEEPPTHPTNICVPTVFGRRDVWDEGQGSESWPVVRRALSTILSDAPICLGEEMKQAREESEHQVERARASESPGGLSLPLRGGILKTRAEEGLK